MKLYTEEQVKKAISAAQLLPKEEWNDFEILEDLELTPIELPNYKEQLDRIEELLLNEEAAKRNRFKIGPL